MVSEQRDIEVKMRRNLLKAENWLSKKNVLTAGKVITIVIFVLIVLGPILYLLLQILINSKEINSTVFNDPILGNEAFLMMLRSIGLSLKIAAIVTVFDILVGVPIAWILARYEFRGKNILDTLVDMPMAVPTSALGFSIYLYLVSRSKRFDHIRFC